MAAARLVPPAGRLLALAVLLAAAPAAAQIPGRVVDAESTPLAGARVCYLLEGEEEHCVRTDDDGRFELPPSQITLFRVVADEFLPQTMPARPGQRPIVLQRTPVLLARLIDADSGEPIADGEVRVNYPTGESKGPFPASAAGVRIRRLLRPGEIRVVGSAEGYARSTPRSVTLRPGEETTVELRLERAPEEP